MTDPGDSVNGKLTFHAGYLIAMLFLLPCANVDAAQRHALDDIRATVHDFVQSTLPERDLEYSINLKKLDPRLRLAACAQPLEAWYPGQGRRAGNLTVGVRCNGKNSWSLYVPVQINYYEDVVVAARPVQRGALLTREDIRLERKNISFHADSYFTDPADLIGQEMVHSLQVGYVIRDRNLKAPVIIKRGQQVTLLAQSNSFEVRMNGKAMADGVIGQRIRVKNLRSDRIVEGVVKSSQIIYVE
mgnify:CR=1 FL=1